jgi:ABC-type antimicrobial peptide transport system permease subunit
MIYFASSFGLNTLLKYNFENSLYFSGGLSKIYSNFTLMIISLILALAFIMVIVVTSSLIMTKKRDIAIMKSLGAIPRKLYSFYLTEVYISFLIGFLVGLLLGFITFLIFNSVMINLGFSPYFYIDFFFTPILFFSCLLGIFFISGSVLRKLGNKQVIDSFSKDIPYSYDASKITLIPRWLTRFGFNFKISIINMTRRTSEFKRYFIVFSFISVIIFTLALGSLVLNSSAQNWIQKSQGEDMVVIGNRELLNNYSNMYELFSNPKIQIDEGVNLLQKDYIINSSLINELKNFSQIQQIDERLLSYADFEELNGYYYYEGGGYQIVGQQRTGRYPIMGINTSRMIQDFEIEGDYFTPANSYDLMFIGDGLAYNFFDYPFEQSARIEQIDHTFHISGVVIDTFFSGYAAYIDLKVMREALNYTHGETNLVLLKLKPYTFNTIKDDLNALVNTSLGEDFKVLSMSATFQKNINFLNNLNLIPGFLILILGIISILSLYNYQKSGIIDKAKDFLIMRALGSKYRNLKRIIFLESLYVILPSLFLSLGVGMILNSIVLFDRVNLPNISVPFLLISIMLVLFLFINYLSVFPLMKKIRKFSIKDFEIY